MIPSQSLLNLFQKAELEKIKIENRAVNAQDVLSLFKLHNIPVEYHVQISEVEKNKFTKYPFGIYRVTHNDIPKVYFLVSPLQDEIQFGLHNDDYYNSEHLIWYPKQETFESFYERVIFKLFEDEDQRGKAL